MSLLMGLTVAMAIVFVSFEWGTQDRKLLVNDRDGGIEWVDEIPATIPEQTPPPPPPPQAVVTDVLSIVDDNVNVDNAGIVTTEDTPDTPLPDFVPPKGTNEEEEDTST
ncbi:MAG: energy transducer TonB, partial [Tannerellaceae bacterium]|nr:energy transducer TonB [Tannerellaceae bacterium]